MAKKFNHVLDVPGGVQIMNDLMLSVDGLTLHPFDKLEGTNIKALKPEYVYIYRILTDKLKFYEIEYILNTLQKA